MTLPFVRSGKSLPGGRATGLLGLALLPLALALWPGALSADVNRNDRDRSGKDKHRGNAALQQAIDFELINVNNVLTIIDNRGIIAQDPRTSGGFGFFPANSPNDYTFGGGIWVGGLVNGVKVVSTGYDASGGFSEFNAGRAAVNGGGADQILCSNNAADLAQWYPEFSDASGQPIVFSQKDCIVIYTDTNQARDVRDPIGLEVRQRTMAFTFGDLSQVVFVVWNIVNSGSNTLTDAFVAANFDMDIGASFQDDRCSAIPTVPPGDNNSSPDTVATNLGFCWDNDFNEGSFDPNPPGFVSMTFFQGPVDTAGDTLGLTRFTLTTNPSSGRPQPDPSSDAEQYDLMAGIGTRAPFIDATAADMRFVEISGPIQFAPGDQQTVVVGLIWANVSNGRTSLDVSPTRCFASGSPCFLPDPNDPALAELVRVQRAAQVIFNANFLAPAPPPKPDITLIPGDHQVTIAWSDVSQVPDPFFSIAGDSTNPAFDPLFREFDFEGFVLVRSTSGNPTDVDTLGIFDLANDVTEIQDTTFRQFQIGDSLFTLPTDVKSIISLPNTGLQFSFTDKGLINGITYFYDVVPFDFNPSNTLRGPNISLSSGISFQPTAVKGVRPRSNASSFLESSFSIAQLLASTGTPVSESDLTRQVRVDNKTQTLLDPIPPSDAVTLQVNVARPEGLPAEPLFVVVDSVIPFDPLLTGGDTRFVGSISYHLETSSGEVVSEGTALGPFFWDFGAGFSAVLPGLAFPRPTAQDLILTALGEVSAPAERGGTIVNPLDVSGSSVVASSIEQPANGGFGDGVRALGYFGALRAADMEIHWASPTEIERVVDVSNGVDIPCTGKTVDSYGFVTQDVGTFADNKATVGIQDVSCTPVYKPTDDPTAPAGSEDLDLYLVGAVYQINGITQRPAAGDVWLARIAFGTSDADGNPVLDGDGDGFLDESGRVPVRGQRFELQFQPSSNDPARADLDKIKTVPNPYVANAVWDFSQDNQRVEFVNLPPVCTIRIYTISGNLVRVIEHTNGSGTEVWDLRTRFNLKAASGTYYWHVTTPDGKTKLGLTSLIQNEVGSN